MVRMDERDIRARWKEGGAGCKPGTSLAPASRRGGDGSYGSPHSPPALPKGRTPLLTASEVAVARRPHATGPSLSLASDLPVPSASSNVSEEETPLQEALPPLLTAEELAALLRVQPKTVYAAIRRRQIPGIVRVGRLIRISRTAVLAWLAGQDREVRSRRLP
jgi:excisionase family DNA binding protein